MLTYLTLLGCIIFVAGGKCPANTEVFTGSQKVTWTAEIDGAQNQAVLAPNDEDIFVAAEGTDIEVKVRLNPPDLKLLEVSIVTKNARRVSIKGFPEKTVNIVPFPIRHTTTTFDFKKERVTEITFTIASQGGEVIFRNAFVRGCVITEWCPWMAWSKCSVTCGVGQMTRSRECGCPNPKPDIFKCPGPSDDVKKCRKPCCRETIDFNNNPEDIDIYVEGPSADLIDGKFLLRRASEKLTILVSNSEGTDHIVVKFKRKRHIIAVGVETWRERFITMTTFPKEAVFKNGVDYLKGVQKTLFKPKRPISKQTHLTLEFAYPKGEIGVRGIYLIVCV